MEIQHNREHSRKEKAKQQVTLFLMQSKQSTVNISSKKCGDCRFFRNPGFCPNLDGYGPQARNPDGTRIIDIMVLSSDKACEIFQPKNSKKTKELTKESAGFCKNGTIFEQVQNDKYVVGKNFEEKNTIEVDGVTYTPLVKQPWMLATKPIKYGGLSFLRTSIKYYLKEHLFLSEPALYDILTSWIIATYTPEVWKSVPYLFFYGPIGSGKTRGLEVMMYLCYRGLLSSNISPSALYRAIEAWNPTVLLDETEILSKESKAEIFGLLNSGYRKGQYAVRVKNSQNGCDLELFNVFGLKALAGTYSLKKATESRSIIINTIKAGKIKVRVTIDEKRALEIRNMLLGYRFYQLADVDVSGVSDVFLDIGDSLDFANGRMLELYTCIIAVAGEDKDNIIDYLKKLSKNKDSEELATEEAEIIQILCKKDSIDGDNFISTSKISKEFNLERIGEDVWNNRRIGWLMRKLGFSSKKIGGNRGWTIQPDRLIKYKEIYMIEETDETDDTPKKTSKTSKTSREELVFFECVDCGKSLGHHEFFKGNDQKLRCSDCNMNYLIGRSKQ